MNAGYRCSATHKEPSAIKTDAPNSVVWDIVRAWVEKHPISKKRKDNDNAPGTAILAKKPTLEVNWSKPKALMVPKTKATRFPHNPEEFWGPKARARRQKPVAAGEEGGKSSPKKGGKKRGGGSEASSSSGGDDGGAAGAPRDERRADETEEPPTKQPKVE